MGLPDVSEEKFLILEEEGYNLEQFLCRCPSKTQFELKDDDTYKSVGKDPIVVVAVTLIDPDSFAPISTKSITTNLEYMVDGIKNIRNLEALLPSDPVSALYVILTNNIDEIKSAKDAEDSGKRNGLNLSLSK